MKKRRNSSVTSSAKPCDGCKRSHGFDGAYVEIDETSGKVIREIRKGTEMDDEDDEEDEHNERRREKTEGRPRRDSFVKKDYDLPKNVATEPQAYRQFNTREERKKRKIEEECLRLASVFSMYLRSSAILIANFVRTYVQLLEKK